MSAPTMDRDAFKAWMIENDVPWEPYPHQIPQGLTDEEREQFERGWIAACFALLAACRQPAGVPS